MGINNFLVLWALAESSMAVFKVKVVASKLDLGDGRGCPSY